MNAFGKRNDGKGGSGQRPSFGVARPMKSSPGGKTPAIGGEQFPPIEEIVPEIDESAEVEGEYDHLPESAFYMVGGIEEAVAKAEKMANDA